MLLLWVLCEVSILQSANAGQTGLMSTCNNVSVNEGETGRLFFGINREIPIENDPDVHILVKKYHVQSNILQCTHPETVPKVKCDVLDRRFKSSGLLDHNLTLTIPNATSSIEGSYELHVAANGIFHPTTSCYLSVNAGGNSEKGESDSSRPSTVAAVAACVVLTMLVIAGVVILYRITRFRKRRARDTKCTYSIEDTSVKDGATLKTPPSLTDSGYTSPAGTPTPVSQIIEVSQDTARGMEDATETPETERLIEGDLQAAPSSSESRHDNDHGTEDTLAEDTQDSGYESLDRAQPERSSRSLTQIKGGHSTVNEIEKQGSKQDASPSSDNEFHKKETEQKLNGASVESESDAQPKDTDFNLHNGQQEKGSADVEDGIEEAAECTEELDADEDPTKLADSHGAFSLRDRSKEGQGRYAKNADHSRTKNGPRGPMAEYSSSSRPNQSSFNQIGPGVAVPTQVTKTPGQLSQNSRASISGTPTAVEQHLAPVACSETAL